MLAAVAFLLVIVLSAMNSAVPVGGAGMPGMPMGGGERNRVALELRDVSGRPLRLPGGRPGVVVFADVKNCVQCVAGARAAARAAAGAGGGVRAAVILVDATTSRGQADAFARAVGVPGARYVVDDRNSTLVSMLDAEAPRAAWSMTLAGGSSPARRPPSPPCARACAAQLPRGRADGRQAMAGGQSDRDERHPAPAGALNLLSAPHWPHSAVSQGTVVRNARSPRVSSTRGRASAVTCHEPGAE